MGLPPRLGTDPVRDRNVDTQYPQYLASYVDALQSLGGNDSLATRPCDVSDDSTTRWLSEGRPHAKSWWAEQTFACATIAARPVRRCARRARSCRRRPRLGLVARCLQDSPCFKRLAAEPRFKAVVDRVEERKRQLRERLPADAARARRRRRERRTARRRRTTDRAPLGADAAARLASYQKPRDSEKLSAPSRLKMSSAWTIWIHDTFTHVAAAQATSPCRAPQLM